MSGDDVPNDDMPNFLRSAPRDGMPFNDAALAALLAGTEPPEPTPGLQPVADVLAALKSGPTADELAGEAGILAEFRRGAGESALAREPRRSRRFSSLLGARAAVAALAVAAGLGGLAGAAYAGVLPPPVQRLAHEAIGAPAVPTSPPARTHSPRTRIPGGPEGIGTVAYRLCTAYAQAQAHGTAAQQAAARHSLAQAAGGVAKIPRYCETVESPGEAQSKRGHSAKRIPPGQEDKKVPPGQEDKKVPPGQQGKGSPPGRRGKGVPPGHQSGHHKHSQGNQNARGNGNQGSQGNQGNQNARQAAVTSASQTPARHRASTSRPSLGRAGPRHRLEG